MNKHDQYEVGEDTWEICKMAYDDNVKQLLLVNFVIFNK